MIKKPTTFVGTAVVATAVVGAIALGVWFAHALLERFLSTPHTFAGVTITPYGHSMESLLTHHFDSLRVSANGSEFTITDPNLDITLLGTERGVKLDIQKLDANINIPENKAKAQESNKAAPQFPENLKIPVTVRLDLKQADIRLSDGRQWNIKGLSLYNPEKKAANLSIKSIEGDYIPSKTSVQLSTDFNDDKLKINGKIKTASDSVQINADLPKENLTNFKGKTKLTIDNPKKWIPAELPPSVPALGKLDVSADISGNLQKGQLNYKATVKTRVGEFWPLLPENVTLHLDGDQERADINLLLQNDEGGSIHLSGYFDKDMSGYLEGYVSHMSAMFGPQMMPLDMQIKSAEFYDQKIVVSAETRQGSNVDAVINLRDSLLLTFTGDISPVEPWALDWTHGNLSFGCRPQVYGVFENGKVRIQTKFGTILNAYHIAADSMQVTLDIDKKGIDFSNGIIYGPKETFDFDGDVKWGTEDPHTSWNVTQRNGGKASAYITIGDTISLDVNADKVLFSTIPFSDIDLGFKIDGEVTGKWYQDFTNNIGKADVSVESNLDAFSVNVNVAVRQNGDTIFIDNFDAAQNRNTVKADGVFILPNDSNPDFKPTNFLPIQLLNVNISSKEFSIPLLLEPLNDSTLTSGMLNGDISYSQENGLVGNLDFYDIHFRKISPTLFNIRKLNIFAEKSKVELNSYLDIGGGGWTGNTQIIIDNIFSDKRHVSFSHGSDNGGTVWASGFIDNDLMFKGTLDANGSWFIPGTVSEIKNTDLHVDMDVDIRKGLKGITADIKLDSTQYQLPKTQMQFPIYLRGHVENGLVDIYEAKTQNDSNEVISATVKFLLDSMKLDAVDIHSKRYSIRRGDHELILENINGHLEDREEDLFIWATVPRIAYKYNSDVSGHAEALMRGNFGFSIPHGQEGIITNNTINGDIMIDKLVFYRDFDIDVTPAALDKYLTMFNNAVANLRSKEVQEAKLSSASPINLSMHISDTQVDSIAIVTPFATFPLTVDLWVLGNTTRPLLRGDVSNTNNGFIGVKDIYEFNLNSFLISWNDVPWQHGVVDVSSSQELPFCSETNEKEKETCPINLDIQGTITNPQPIPSSNCGTESTPAVIYYNVLLGCIADDNGEQTDWNKLAGKAIGKVISTTANKTLGGDYIGDIDMKVMLFENNTTSDKDSSYFKVPVSLDRWVKNLSLIFGYTQDQSENPTYDQSLQFGINYTLPVFQEAEYSHRNHISPTLALNAMLISKQYLANTGTETNNEARMEKNIGIDYIYRFWNPCLLGIGKCEGIQPQSTKKEKNQ